MKVIIDRIENDIAVVELPDKTLLNVPAVLFCDAKEGSIINITVEESKTYTAAIFEKLRNKK